MWILCLAEDSLETLSYFLWKTMKKYLWISSAAVVSGTLRVKRAKIITVIVLKFKDFGFPMQQYKQNFQMEEQSV